MHANLRADALAAYTHYCSDKAPCSRLLGMVVEIGAQEYLHCGWLYLAIRFVILSHSFIIPALELAPSKQAGA